MSRPNAAEELERQLREEEDRMRLVQEEIARLRRELESTPTTPAPAAAGPGRLSAPNAVTPSRSEPPRPNGSPRTASPAPQPTAVRPSFSTTVGSGRPSAEMAPPLAASGGVPRRDTPPSIRPVAVSGASPTALQRNGSFGETKRTVARPPPPGGQNAMFSSTPALGTAASPPTSQQGFSAASLTMSTPSQQPGSSAASLNASSPLPQQNFSPSSLTSSTNGTPQISNAHLPSPPVRKVSQSPGPAVGGGFSASSLLPDDGRGRADSFEMIGGNTFNSQRTNSNGALGMPPPTGSPNISVKSNLNTSQNGTPSKGFSASGLSGGFSAASLTPTLTSKSSNAEFFPGKSQSPGIGFMPSSDDGGMLTGGFAPMSTMQPSSSGTPAFGASSLLGAFNSDEAEMLRGPAGAGFTINPMMLPRNSGGGEDGALIGAPTTGFLPSATPEQMVVDTTVQKGLDRVEDDLVQFSKNFQIILKGGTISKVIEKLTAESQADNSVVDTFLLTYRKFISPELLLEELMKRYNLPPPRPLEMMDQHSIGVYDHALKVVRLRVGNFIKRWLSEHFQDFRGNEALIDRLAAMCRQTFLLNEKTLGEKILSVLEEQRKKLEGEDQNRAGTMTARGDRPEPIIPKSSLFQDFDPIEVARQLSLFEQSIYRQIHPKECLDQCWSKKDRYNRAPNMMRLIDFFNSFASWVATQVLKHKGIEDRVKEIKRFMRMAVELRRLNNFNGCQEVLAGLNDSSIHRLRASWMKVEKEEKLVQEFEEAKKILSPDRSWVNYRGILKEIQPPCIPYLGVYLTDLTFIEDGNPNYLPTIDNRNDIINFEKCRKQALVIGNILLYQQDAYNFQRVDVIYDMFAKGLVVIDDKEALHKLSRQVESAEMVEEAKRKAAKKAEKDAKKKNETPTKGGAGAGKGTPTTPSYSSMASRDPSRYNSTMSRDPSRQMPGSPSLSSSPSSRGLGDRK